jgi:hypothetical protein
MSDTFSLLRFGILVRHNISRRLFGLETAILMFEKSFESIVVIGVAGCLFIDSTGVKFPVYIECTVILRGQSCLFVL